MLVRTHSETADFKSLRDLLDKELWEMYPVIMSQYAPHNILPEATPALVYYQDEKPVAIGAFKEIRSLEAIEVKRMYTHPEYRGLGLGRIILEGLEKWGRELGIKRAVLETGTKNMAAHKLYEKMGYRRIENYEPYVGMDGSLCFGKAI